MKGTSPIAAKKGESAGKKKFKGLLCFDGECEFWSAASALQNNALNAFSHLQYGYILTGGSHFAYMVESKLEEVILG